MEVFGIIGMSMGTMGFIFGIYGMNAMNQVALLRKEHDALKQSLIDSGVLTGTPEPE
ncbi:MAG: hypothetical protein ABJ000_12505 [Saccharospirillum sp.]|uniref:hypothetical protein n=1 Tax=Saccharospirillum sp. TaxID=2033801 RepID=UPI003298E7FF